MRVKVSSQKDSSFAMLNFGLTGAAAQCSLPSNCNQDRLAQILNDHDHRVKFIMKTEKYKL